MPPKFTKKHYIEIARLLGQAPLPSSHIEVLVQAFIRLFQDDNESFDTVRFERMVHKEYTNGIL